MQNSVDPDQTSDLGLHCLPRSQFWDIMHKWVKIVQDFFTFNIVLKEAGGLRFP